MANITRTAANVRLVNENEAIKLRGTVGATITPGQPVYLDGTSGWKPADADAAASGLLRGLALSDGYGSVSFAIGTVIDIVVFGRVAGFSGMTPGANVYVSLDAGELTHTAPPDSGDFIVAAGWSSASDVLFVNPQITVPTANAS